MVDMKKICDIYYQELRNFKAKNEYDLLYFDGKFIRQIIDAFNDGLIVYPKSEEEAREEARDVINEGFDRIDGFSPKGPIAQIDMSYNMHDSLESDKKITSLANNIKKKIEKHFKNTSERKWLRPLVKINLKLEKGASLYGIDKYFERLFKELKGSYNANTNIYITFGEKEFKNHDVRYLLDAAQIDNICKLQSVLNKYGSGKLLFYEKLPFKNCWDLSQLLKANNCIQDLAKTIKENNLSPFEALLYITTWTQKNITYAYYSESNSEESNTIISAVNNKHVKCVGFSQFVLAVVKSLGIKYLQGNHCLMDSGAIASSSNKEFQKDRLAGNHSQSKCYLIDEKYNIDGEVIVDAQGFMLKKLKLEGDISLATKIPVTTFSTHLSNKKYYKIYSNQNMEKSDAVKKTQKQILKETEENARIAKCLEQSKIDDSVYKKAYEKILPLLFSNLKHGDVVAPIPYFLLDNQEEGAKALNIQTQNSKVKDFWLSKF